MDFMSMLWWLLFIFMLMEPAMQQWHLQNMRNILLARLEKKRKSRVITLIHRQETISFFGLPISRFINIDDSEAVLSAIRSTPDDVPIDLIIHTPGGLVLAAEQIAKALKRHKAPTRVIVPHYAMSGGTLIALAADEIIMDENAVLGPVDPQLGTEPAASIVKAVEEKGADKVDDATLIKADMSRKALKQVKEFVKEMLLEHYTEDDAERIADILSQGTWTHDYPLFKETLNEILKPQHGGDGIKISTDVPTEVYMLMKFYPQPSSRRPSVSYIPHSTGDWRNK
ncbi:hypothetical protein GM182_05040 [bacterium 3DAC]|nr:hypothetical protein [Dictyoglomota bacterium]UZN23247.1 hypothetical protein GM182_05040 [bacterium 3DAC]